MATTYEDLTPEIVQGWTESALGAEQISEMQLALANDIEAQKQPKGGNMAPPWQQ